MVKNVDLHQVFLQLEALEAMITVTPNQWEVTTMGVAGRMRDHKGQVEHFFQNYCTLSVRKSQQNMGNMKYIEICLMFVKIQPLSSYEIFESCHEMRWFVSNLYCHTTGGWDVYWPCYGKLCLIFQYQFPRLWEPESGWWSRCQNIYLKRRLCDSVLTSISEISLKGIDIESCHVIIAFPEIGRIQLPQPLVVGKKFCRSHRWCLHRTCDGGFLVPFVGSDGWSLGRSLGGKQSPCLCSSDSAGKGRGNVELKK